MYLALVQRCDFWSIERAVRLRLRKYMTRSSVGGGHNGLTAAAYLARAGLTTLVLERREIVGGCCVTEEIAPGCRVSTTSYIASMLRPEVISDLRLARTWVAHGSLRSRDSGSLPRRPGRPLVGKPRARGGGIQKISAQRRGDVRRSRRSPQETSSLPATVFHGAAARGRHHQPARLDRSVSCRASASAESRATKSRN